MTRNTGPRLRIGCIRNKKGKVICALDSLNLYRRQDPAEDPKFRHLFRHSLVDKFEIRLHRQGACEPLEALQAVF